MQVARSLVGSYITSLDMAGTSVTLLKVDDELLSLWDAPVQHSRIEMGHLTHEDDTVSAAALDQWVRAFAGLVEENRELLTDLDAAIGDGDHGANMDRGMQAVVAALDEHRTGNGRRPCSTRSA